MVTTQVMNRLHLISSSLEIGGILKIILYVLCRYVKSITKTNLNNINNLTIFQEKILIEKT